ncbi:MAG: hypothetical protein GY737_19670 [Desulfobacteraceae bacterium]|nr:hypothetical protein [Desulfobacteraceae bacterium]
MNCFFRTISCAILILIAQDVFGGEIVELYNKLPKGKTSLTSHHSLMKSSNVRSSNHGIIEAGIESTPCYPKESCKSEVFTFIVNADGRVRYHGMNNVALKGSHTGKVDISYVNDFFWFFRESHFFKLNDSYDAPFEDAASDFYYVKKDGEQKVILDYGKMGHPLLWAVRILFHDIMDHVEWFTNEKNIVE